MTDETAALQTSVPVRKPARKPASVPAPGALVETAVVETAAPLETAETAAAETVDATVTNARKGFFDMATAFSTTPENVQNMFGDMRERAKSSMEKGAKLAEDLTEFTKGNVEAVIASGRVAAKGVETLGREAVDYSRKSFESATAAVKDFSGAKSPTELFQLQSDFARSSFDAMVAEGSRVTEAWLKLGGEIVQPLSSRFAVAAEKVKSTVA